jgi:Phage integrase family
MGTGTIPSRHGLNRLIHSGSLVKWAKLVAGIGVPNLRFHDLRHTGNTLAAPGASLRDLMTRMGHDSPRAVMIYQHATTVEDRAIADRLSGLVDAHRAESDDANEVDFEAYAKPTLKKYRPMAARNEDKKVFNGLL